MSGDILCFSENADLAGELATAGSVLASQTKGRAVDLEVDLDRETVSAETKILIKANERLSDNPELIAKALISLAGRLKPSVVLVGSSRIGRQVAARVAAQLRTGALGDVRKLAAEGGRLTGERSVYSGKFLTKVSSPLPCVATVPSGANEKRAGPSGGIEVVQLDVSGTVRRVETRPKPKASVDLKTASIIVSAGRGFKKKEDLVLVEQLAAAMGGVVGSSRPLTSDLGWLGEEHHIGLTGFYVHPDLYLAVGISGQLQHVAGIKDSKVIAAINKDKQAPIFQVADYGIVGDLHQVIPALLKLLEKKSG